MKIGKHDNRNADIMWIIIVVMQKVARSTQKIEKVVLFCCSKVVSGV